MLILPYQYGVEDQTIHNPIISKEINPLLFRNDYLLINPKGSTLFYPLMKYIVILFTSLQTASFFVYISILFLSFLSIYFLAITLFKKRIVGLLSVTIFLFPKWVGGTGVMTYESYLLPRLFSTPLVCLSLILMAKRNYLWAAIISGVTFLIHPVSAVTLYILLFVLIALNKREIKKPILPFGIIIIFSLIFLVIVRKEFIEDTSYFLMPKEWLSIAQIRDRFVFPQYWKLRSFISVLIFYFYYLLFLLRKRIINYKEKLDSNTSQFIYTVIIVTLTLPMILILLSEFLPITMLIQLELARSLVIFSYMAIVCFAYFTYLIITYRIRIFLKFFFIALFIVSIVWNNTIQYRIDPDWIDIQLWSKNNTDINSLFLTNPNEKGFRIYSNRAIVGEYKDGGPVLFSYEYALEWDNRMKIISDFDKFTENNFLEVRKTFPYDYLVVANNKRLNFKKIYQNKSYVVYHVSLPASDAELLKD